MIEIPTTQQSRTDTETRGEAINNLDIGNGPLSGGPTIIKTGAAQALNTNGPQAYRPMIILKWASYSGSVLK